MGWFVTFEGTEGSGKSTQLQRLAQRIAAEGREVVTVREPGGTPMGEQVRNLLKHGGPGVPICAEAELLLVNASRAQLVRDVIRPALAAGKAVLCDRFFDSTIAYQVFGRCLDNTHAQRIIEFAIGETRPDLTLLLRVPIEVSEQRRRARGAAEAPDRMEEEGREFFRRVAHGYDAVAANTASRVRTIDAAQSVSQVEEEIWKWVAPLIRLPAAQGDRAWKTVGEYRESAPD